MKKIIAALVLASLVPSVWAITYDANVNVPGPGVFFGSGNANGGWTVDTANGIELGLRTHERYDATGQPQNVFNSGGNGVYSWTDPSAGTPANRSSWNFDFSLNVSGTGLGISDFTYKLFIDSDPTAGHSWTFYNPSLIPDNAVSGTAYAQNSENARFAVGIPGYVNATVGTYDFALFAYDASGNQLAETYMRVNVNGGTATGSFDGNVPDAGTTAGMLGFALVGLGALRRKLTA